MREVLLDLSHTVSRDELHDVVEAQFAFQDYYGRNLDALYDLLSASTTKTGIVTILPPCAFDKDEEGEVRIRQSEYDPEYPAYLERFCCLLKDIEAENPQIEVFLLLPEDSFPGEDHELEI